MKRIAILLLCLTLIFAFSACELSQNPNSNLNSEAENMELLVYLKNNISAENSLDEIINTFEEMCKNPIEEDLLLNEYGVYDFTGEDLFYYDLVRQYPDGEDEYYQLRVSIMFSPDKKTVIFKIPYGVMIPTRISLIIYVSQMDIFTQKITVLSLLI